MRISKFLQICIKKITSSQTLKMLQPSLPMYVLEFSEESGRFNYAAANLNKARVRALLLVPNFNEEIV